MTATTAGSVPAPIEARPAMVGTPLAMPPEIRSAIIARLLKSSDSTLRPDQVGDELLLRDDLGLASIDSLELALNLEEDLGVVLEDSELYGLRSVGDLMNAVAGKLASRKLTG